MLSEALADEQGVSLEAAGLLGYAALSLDERAEVDVESVRVGARLSQVTMSRVSEVVQEMVIEGYERDLYVCELALRIRRGLDTWFPFGDGLGGVLSTDDSLRYLTWIEGSCDEVLRRYRAQEGADEGRVQVADSQGGVEDSERGSVGSVEAAGGSEEEVAGRAGGSASEEPDDVGFMSTGGGFYDNVGHDADSDAEEVVDGELVGDRIEES